MNQLIGTQEAAEIVGVSVRTIPNLILSGRLQATKVGRDWVIWRSDVKAYAAKPGRKGLHARPIQYRECKVCGTPFHWWPSSNQEACSPACARRHKGETSLEKRVHQALHALGIDHKREASFRPYLVDFLLPELDIALEADGTHWHGLPGNAERDRRKDAYLESQGWKVCRINEADINGSDPVAVVAAALSRMDGVEMGTLQLSFA